MSCHTSHTITITDNTILCLIAPTASGKTALAYELYDRGGCELISVDSALIYQGMNIGTAKPTAQELLRYPHHLVDIIQPTEGYNVADFVQTVKQLIADIQGRGNVPVLVGGTMMYYMALLDGISPVPHSDVQMRKDVELWRQSEGIHALYQYLHHHDPITAQRLNVNDTQRITRAVEVYKQTDQPISYWQQLPKNALAKQDNNQWQVLSVLPDRSWLHDRIALRLEQMWQGGFIDEVIGLINKYELSIDSPSMRCVGYRQVIDCLLMKQLIVVDDKILRINNDNNTIDTKNWLTYINNTCPESCQEMKNKALYATRQLAKRQFTWLRKLNSLNNTDNKNCPSIHMNMFSDVEQIQAKLIW